MKNIAIIISFVTMTVMTFFIIQSLQIKEYRTVELSEAVDNAMIATMDNIAHNKCYGIGSDEELVEDFKEMLMTSLDSDSDIDIDVISADCKKGELCVNVTEKYKYLNNRIGTLVRTGQMVIDQKKLEKRYYTMEYYVNDSIYKCIGAAEGEAVILPRNPELEGHKFIGWKRENGEMLSLDGNNGIVTSDEKLSAVFE